MMCRRLSLLLLGALMTQGNLFSSTPAEDAAATVVIYNRSDPSSKELADFYSAARSIDSAQEISITAPLTEEISRSDYDLTIATPLRQEMVDRGYWIVKQNEFHETVIVASRIHYAAVMRGMPLKIAECTNYPGDNAKLQPPPFGSSTAASLDSELSVLGLFTSQLSGVLNNPLSARKNTNFKTAKIPPALLMVGRLDAPTVDEVKSMIKNGIRAEKEGLWGWGYIDLRSTTDPGYILGDQWIRKAGDVMRAYGIPVLSDDLPETYPRGFPITDAAAYFGWYSGNIDGPFSDPNFHFLPGAVAAHLHSFSAATLRNPTLGWTTPLIVHGASASVGNVYEPYLVFTTDFGTMEESLLAGNNLAQSYYPAQPVLSWMSVLVGDPLYRPYARLNDQIAIQTRWTDYREIILKHHGDVLRSAHDLGVEARKTHQSLYLEALGAAQYDAGEFAAAGASFRDASELTQDSKIYFRLLLEQARVMEKEGKPEKGAALLSTATPKVNDPEQRSLLLAWITRMSPLPPKSQPSVSSRK